MGCSMSSLSPPPRSTPRVFVRTLTGQNYDVLWSYGEDMFEMYKLRVQQAGGPAFCRQRLLFAGCERSYRHHSGLQRESTVHMVLRKVRG